MTDPMRAETVDNELTRHCAYSLPAVALTLGRQNWPVLKDTYETLAGDMHVSKAVPTSEEFRWLHLSDGYVRAGFNGRLKSLI